MPTLHLRPRPSSASSAWTSYDAGECLALSAARLAGVAVTVRVASSEAEIAKLRPFGSAPILELDASTADASEKQYLARSPAIARFLVDHQAASSKMSAFDVARVDEWMALAQRAALHAAVAIAPVIAKSAPKPDEFALAAVALEDLARDASPLERYLMDHTYLVGERISLADVAMAAALCAPWALVVGPSMRSGLGNTTRWLETVCNNSAVFALPEGVATPFTSCAKDNADITKAKKASSSSHKPAGNASSSTSLTSSSSSTLFSRTRTRVKELLASGKSTVGESHVVCGWARTVRGTNADKGPVFIELNDGSCLSNLQVVCLADDRLVRSDVEAVLAAGGVGASFRVEGEVVESPAQGQAIELRATKVSVLGGIPDAAHYPLAKSKTGHSAEYLREIAHLRPRTNLISSMQRVRHVCAMAVHNFFNGLGFSYVHTPILTAADCEGAGEMFQVTTIMDSGSGKLPPTKSDKTAAVDYSKDFFHRPAFLTVSGQLNVECYACALSDVYTFGPTFRAENSNTTRHLAEFWMIEPEMCFAGLKEDMDLAEDFTKSVVREVMAQCMEDLVFFDARVEKGLLKRLENLLEAPFVRLTYSQAIVVLEKDHASGKAAFDVAPEWGIDLGSEHERYLTEQVFMRPVILTNYPAAIKAFYMRRSQEDPRTVEAMDVLVPRIGELIGGSARETDFDALQQRVKEQGLEMPWYMDLRRYGSVPHAGFGLGFERLVMLVTGILNIRDVIPFPRYPGNVEF